MRKINPTTGAFDEVNGVNARLVYFASVGSNRNFYEGTLKLTSGGTTKYYAGATPAEKDTAVEILRAVAAEQMWQFESEQENGLPYGGVEEIVDRNDDEAITAADREAIP